MDYCKVSIYIFYLFSIHLVTSKIVVEAKDESRVNNAPATSNTDSGGIEDYDYSCSVGQYECRVGYCIESYQLCDGYDDCADGRDELECSTNGDYDYGCSPEQFDCGGGECIEQNHLCDGFEDCPSASDERNCPKVTAPTCAENQFACGDNTCITNDKVCDGTRHCANGKDEQECRRNTTTTQTTTTTKPTDDPEWACPDDYFVCDICLEQEYVCDGFEDCYYGADEADCPSSSNTITTRSSLSSTVKGSITASPVQETTTPMAPSSFCGLNEHQCGNGDCIRDSDVCNGRNDCGDGSDEVSCPVSTTSPIINAIVTTPVHTKSKKNRKRCLYQGKEYDAGTKIESSTCRGITCNDDGKYILWVDPTCAACLTAKSNLVLLVLASVISLLNWK